MKRIIFIGANNPETLRVMNAVNRNKVLVEYMGFIDNDPKKKGTFFVGLPVFGGFEVVTKLLAPDNYFVNLITRDCVTRYETSIKVRDLGGQFTNFIHPSVNLEMVSLGEGNYIQENVVLQADVVIGNNSSIHMGSLVGHESKVGSSVFIAHGCNISGLVSLKDGVFVGTGTTILPRLTVGEWSIIGAGTVVTQDVPPYCVVVGNPGRIIKNVNVAYEHADIFKAR